jgi:hypothetical protein
MASIASLLSERIGYVRRGLNDRVRQVDDQLKKLDHVVDEVSAIEHKVETASMRKPRKKA